MNLSLELRKKWIGTLLLPGLCLGAVGCASEVGQSAPPLSEQTLQLRVPADKNSPFNRLPEGAEAHQLVVKFNEGTDVRLQGGSLVSNADNPLPNSAGVDSRAELDADLSAAETHLADRGIQPASMFDLPDSELERLKENGEANTGRELADLGLYLTISPSEFDSDEEMEATRAYLNGLDSVEVAYIEPKAEPAQLAPADANTPDMVPEQGYRGPAPLGIDADYANTVAGGRGNNVAVVDVEFGWNENHEDLPNFFFTAGGSATGASNQNHGTAVLGEIASMDNGFGTMGIVPEAQIGYSGVSSVSTAQAIATAMSAVDPGDAILIELHRRGPATVSCTCNTPQCNYIALEYWQADFDAISTATANDIAVIEAAGNGSVDLDDATYGGAFDRSVRDSGAIVVGASGSGGRAPTCWTNNGTRVDVHGWGNNVVTTGYGDRYAGGDSSDSDDWYTAQFSGTSSASPIVTGASLAVQSMAIENLGAPLTPAELRDLLTDTGTPQDADLDREIGSLPNLRAAANQLLGGTDDCVEHEATVGEHEQAGRVACTREMFFFWEVISECHAVGSNDDVGTDLGATVTLAESPQGVFSVGSCENACGDEEICDDGIDNDCDGEIDEDCGTCSMEICDDGLDNDCDGQIDGDDTDCEQGSCTEFSGTVGDHEDAGRVECTRQLFFFWETIVECHAVGSNDDVGTNLNANVTLRSSQSGYFSVGSCDDQCGTEEICDDDIDNDCDGEIDEDCQVCGEEICGDSIDNDCDGEIDEDCQVCSDEICDDGIDNDCDGDVDADDADCQLQCAPPGELCFTANDCCSGQCNSFFFFGTCG